nr:carboxypeptidase-like regulatory domain-containing protein [uncultured Capnocytophaga sp.]
MTRLAIFLFFFTLSTMAQITVSGRVFDDENKPFPRVIVSNGREKVYTDAQGKYTIQAKLFDILEFSVESEYKGYKMNKQYYYVIKNIPHQKYKVQLDSDVIYKYFVDPYTLSFSFYLDDSKVEKSNEEAFKERVRNGEFYTYQIRTCDELPETIEKLSRYTVLVYTKNYYNEHIKNKSKKK